MGKRKGRPASTHQPQPQSTLEALMDPSFSPPTYFPSTITDEYDNKVLTINAALSAEECSRLKNYVDTSPNVTVQHQPRTSEYTFRHNDRLQITDPGFARFLFQRLRPLLSTHVSLSSAVGMNSNIRLYRYSKGQRFDAHYDMCNEVNNGITRWTVLYYLNDVPRACGGSTAFYKFDNEKDVAADVSCVEGVCLLHLHGDECLLHKGSEVLRGVKYLLRTDLVF